MASYTIVVTMCLLGILGVALVLIIPRSSKLLLIGLLIVFTCAPIIMSFLLGWPGPSFSASFAVQAIVLYFAARYPGWRRITYSIISVFIFYVIYVAYRDCVDSQKYVYLRQRSQASTASVARWNRRLNSVSFDSPVEIDYAVLHDLSRRLEVPRTPSTLLKVPSYQENHFSFLTGLKEVLDPRIYRLKFVMRNGKHYLQYLQDHEEDLLNRPLGRG